MSTRRKTTKWMRSLCAAGLTLAFSMAAISNLVHIGASGASSNQYDDEAIGEMQKKGYEAGMRRNEHTSPKHESASDGTRVAGWMLVLVNAANPLPDDYSINLKSLDNGLKFDERAIDQLKMMLCEARKQGLSPIVCSAYRTVKYQRKLYNNKVSRLIGTGLSRKQAQEKARTSVAYPGTSEHNLGLAVDIVSTGYRFLNSKQARTPEIEWITENCATYGFILRYPKGKEAITGVIYEPWHFRYVGVIAAREIMENGITLEEYLDSYASD